MEIGRRLALRNTQRLVLVATREAVTQSAPVEREVEIFTSRDRHIIPIVFGDTFTDLDRDQYRVLSRLKESQLYIDEDPSNLLRHPSQSVIDQLHRTHKVMRKRGLRTRLLRIVILLLTTFSIATAIAAWIANDRNIKLAREIVTTLVGNVFLTSSADLTPRDFQEKIVSHLAVPERRESVLAEFDKRRDTADPSSQEDPIVAGKQRADAAIVLLKLDALENAIRFLSCSPQDPEPISQFVARCKQRGGVDQATLTAALELAYRRLGALRRDPTSAQVDGPPDTIRQAELTCYGLILALGEFKNHQGTVVPPSEFIGQLEDWYQHDPSSAIHGATGWLLRQSGEDARARVREIDEENAVTAVENLADMQKEWFVLKLIPDVQGKQDSIYLTFIVFQPGSFKIGSPPDEEGRNETIDFEKLTPVTISDRFAVCDREVTNGQWQQFKQFGGTPLSDDAENPVSGDAEKPVIGVSQEDVNSVCDTLSKLISGPLQFRLPHETEWEYACRGGAATPFNFGSDVDLLDRFARAGPCDEAKLEKSEFEKCRLLETAQLWPSTRGLFDMHGNANEWCGNRQYLYDAPERKLRNPAVRGGGVGKDKLMSRSAARNPPQGKHGFRLFLAPPRSP